MDKLKPEQLIQIGKLVGHETGPTGRFTIKADKKGRYFSKAYQTIHEFLQHSFTQNKDQDFIVFQDRRYTYAESWEIIVSLGCLLRFHYKIDVGDRVAVAAKNLPEWCFSFLAILLIGGVAVPLNGWWKVKEMEYGLADSGTKLVFCDHDRFLNVKSSIEKLNLSVILIDDKLPYQSPNVTLFKDALEIGRKFPQELRLLKNLSANDHDALIMYTSGTTGNPKGVLLSQKATCNQLEVAYFALFVQGEVGKLLGVPPNNKFQQCIICATPLFHVTSSHHILLTAILRGAKLILLNKWDPTYALKLIETERVTNITGVPTMLQDLMEHPNFERTDISSVQSIGSGGAPIAPSQVFKTREKFKIALNPTVETRNGYGMTETSGAISFNTGATMATKPTSCGQPFPIVEVKIVDSETKKQCPPGQKGQLHVRSVLNLTCYWNKPEATREALCPEGWFATGDVAYLDEANFIHIVDREKDIVIRGGENISCTEVENEIFSHPAILDCAVIGFPDERLGEVLGAVINFKPGVEKISPKEIRAFLKPKLADFKIPSENYIFIWEQPLLKGATAKTHKRDIKAKILEDLNSKKCKL